jgi:uncharacterized protein (DUF1697 family)
MAKAAAASATHIALLYSITTGNGGRMAMADLRAMAEDLGFLAPKTVIATGNLLFAAKSGSVTQIESKLEAAHTKNFGNAVDYIVRKASDWPKILAGNPFAKESKRDPSHVIARVMRAPVDKSVIAALKPYAVDGEVMEIVGGDLWVYFAHGIGRSKLAAAMTPKRAGIGTARNWNTMQAIGALLEG